MNRDTFSVHCDGQQDEPSVLRRCLCTAVLMTLAAGAIWLLTPVLVIPPKIYLPLHTIAEIFAVSVALLVFACAWHAGNQGQPRNIVLIGCAFLCVALLDLGHLLSFAGMPDFVTPAGPEKAINFWLAGRLVEALALLAAVALPWRLPSARDRRLLLCAFLALAGVIYWVVLFHQDVLPRTFIPGIGLTAFKVGTEYAIVAIHLTAAAVLFASIRHGRSFDAANLFAANVAMALGELFFTGYDSVTDVYNLTGHVYKVLAAVFVYRAVFMDTVRRPVQALLDAEEREKQQLQGALVETNTDLALSEQRLRWLRELTAHQERIKEEERKRIAREIHDELGQTLLALRLEATMLAERTADTHPDLNERLCATLSLTDGAVKSVKAIINDLRPSVLDLGLLAAIEWQVGQFQRRSNIACTLDVDAEDVDHDLEEDRALALFRVVQESLTNIKRHASASLVCVKVRRDADRISMTIGDNGVGIADTRRHGRNSFGLVGIEERITALGGSFAVDTAPGKGTTLRLAVPVSAEQGSSVFRDRGLSRARSG